MYVKDDVDVMMVTLLYLTKASILLLPLSIHFWLWENYHTLVSQWGQGDQRVLAHVPLYEYLCNKLIYRGGSNCGSQRKPVWLNVLVPESGKSSAEANI